MSDAGIYSAEELLAKKMASPEALIEGLIWERDNILIIGSEKVGKSILAVQIAFSLTSGQPLFGEYKVKRPSVVLYVQMEGKLDATQDRMIQMLKVNECNTKELWIAYFPALALDTDRGMAQFLDHIDYRKIKPNIIIIDPLYHAMKGSLIDEEDSRHMTMNLRVLSDRYMTTLILIHHSHRPIRTRDGEVIDTGDNAIFGSFVWKAWPDHILLFKLNKDGARTLSCTTQRSGKVMEREDLVLTDGPYLGFDRKADTMLPYERNVLHAFESVGGQGTTREELITGTGLSLSSVEKSIRKLILERLVVRMNSGEYPVKYVLRKV